MEVVVGLAALLAWAMLALSVLAAEKLFATRRRGESSQPLMTKRSGLPTRLRRVLKKCVRSISGAKALNYFQWRRRWPEGQLYPTVESFNDVWSRALTRSRRSESFSVASKVVARAGMTDRAIKKSAEKLFATRRRAEFRQQLMSKRNGLPTRLRRVLKKSVRSTSGAKALNYFQWRRRWPEGQLYRESTFSAAVKPCSNPEFCNG